VDRPATGLSITPLSLEIKKGWEVTTALDGFDLRRNRAEGKSLVCAYYGRNMKLPTLKLRQWIKPQNGASVDSLNLKRQHRCYT